jgi:hypothetical protein
MAMRFWRLTCAVMAKIASLLIDQDGLVDDVKTAVASARGSSFVDGSKLVVIGHSMGGGAAMRYALRDPKLVGTAMIAGLWPLEGPAPPRNPLFVFAQYDPPPLRDALKHLAAQLGKVDHAELGKTYGDFAHGDAVRVVEVAGADHMTLPAASTTAESIVRWLDATTGTPRSGAVIVKDSRRLVSLIAFSASLVLLVAIGGLTGDVAPVSAPRAAGSARAAMLGLFGALVISMPLVTLYAPGSFLGLDDGDGLVSWLAIGGFAICVVLGLRGQLPVPDRVGRSLLAGLAAFLAIYLMYVPLGAVVHRLSLSPPRAIAMIIAAVLLTPFFLGFEALVRRGGVARSMSHAVAGRFGVVVLLFLGAAGGVITVTFVFFEWIVLVLLMLLEIFATAAYAASGNILTIAVAEALSFAWLLAGTMPIRF